MFSEEENASKVALAALEERLRASGFELFDVQFLTPHLRSMGAVEIPRTEYLSRLHAAAARDVRLKER
jgi:leucyl/phenylalanyl-tRNA---protein transferase